MDEDQGGGDGSSPNSSFNNKNKGEGDVDAASFSRLKELQSTSLWVYDLLPSAARRDLSNACSSKPKSDAESLDFQQAAASLWSCLVSYRPLAQLEASALRNTKSEAERVERLWKSRAG